MNDIKSIRFPPPVADGMVRAILEGRKTVTRRVVKPQPKEQSDDLIIHSVGGGYITATWMPSEELIDLKLPCFPGDILYVRETWAKVGWFCPHIGEWNQQYEYKASYKPDYRFDAPAIKWRPSIHMPREAARIFLRVTDVRVERLQEISEESAVAEGCTPLIKSARFVFGDLWDSTIKKADLALYGWEANPWVWVIEFERCEKPEGD